MIRPGCVICGHPFVKGDFPTIVAWTSTDGEQQAAHGSCWAAMQNATEELGEL